MKSDYDVIVIGGGAAGLTAAGVAIHLGARTLMIEQNRLGGDCTWTGCIPSKTLLHAASVAETVRTAGQFGVSAGTAEVDFAHVMTRVRAIRQHVYEDADRPEIYRDLGVHIRTGSARFVDPHTLALSDGTSEDSVTGSFIFVCTGGSPAVPPIAGLDKARYLTSETLFELNRRPDHLIVLGAGPIGTEMAQAFRRLGSEVTVLDIADRILSNDDADLALMLQRRLEAEGVRFILNADIRRIDGAGDGGGEDSAASDDSYDATVHLGGGQILHGSALLVATGRRPNVGGLGLEAVGIGVSKKGIEVNDYCRTSVSNVYAAGDVTGRFQFTHMSEHMAKKAVMNALLKVPTKIDTSSVPWVTFTDPELAHVGATEADLQSSGSSYKTYRFPFARLDRAITEGREAGSIIVHATKWTGKILGASVLGTRAGELICEFALAMRNGISLRQISDTIHPYPSYGLGVRRAADQWYAQRHSPKAVNLIKSLFGYRGPVREIGPTDII